jgi:hypothetical protein
MARGSRSLPEDNRDYIYAALPTFGLLGFDCAEANSWGVCMPRLRCGLIRLNFFRQSAITTRHSLKV